MQNYNLRSEIEELVNQDPYPQDEESLQYLVDQLESLFKERTLAELENVEKMPAEGDYIKISGTQWRLLLDRWSSENS